MAKAELNPLLAALHGPIGNLVLVHDGNRIYVRAKGERTVPSSESQVAHTSRFGMASRWAKTLLTDPVVKAAYARACHDHLTAHNIAVHDYLHGPVIDAIGLESYTGNPGDLIRILATDDFKIARVTVQLRTAGGDLIEQGAAEWNVLENNWLYTAQTGISPGTTLRVEATAFDLPGNQARAKAYHYVEPTGSEPNAAGR
jgi:hypothetical protein